MDVLTMAAVGEVEVPPLPYNLVFGESVLNDAGELMGVGNSVKMHRGQFLRLL